MNEVERACQLGARPGLGAQAYARQVGGNFFTAQYVYSVSGTQGIASWDGVKWNNMVSGASGRVYALERFGTSLYAGGFFNAIGLTTANSYARWDGSNWFSTGYPAVETVVQLLHQVVVNLV